MGKKLPQNKKSPVVKIEEPLNDEDDDEPTPNSNSYFIQGEEDRTIVYLFSPKNSSN